VAVLKGSLNTELRIYKIGVWLVEIGGIAPEVKEGGVEAQLSNYNPRAAPRGGLSALILPDLTRGLLDSRLQLTPGCGKCKGGRPRGRQYIGVVVDRACQRVDILQAV
jgi:hypothetical protein